MNNSIQGFCVGGVVGLRPPKLQKFNEFRCQSVTHAIFQIRAKILEVKFPENALKI